MQNRTRLPVLLLISTLRNLGRFSAPVLTAPVLVGPGGAAPFVGGTLLAGGLGPLLLGWMGLCRFRPALLSPGRAGDNHSRSDTQPSLCNAPSQNSHTVP